MTKNASLYPAPWSWDGEFPIQILDAEGHYVVSSGGMMPSGEANARVIVAAPAMLEALREIAKGEGRYSRDPLEHASNTIEDMKALALAAIAKVEGE